MQTAHPNLKTDFSARTQFLKDHSDKGALAALIDHTQLKMDAQESDFSLLFDEANKYHFRAICIPGSALESLQAKINSVQGQQTMPQFCTVVGFPHGNNATEGKLWEVAAALDRGANEFDYVQNLGWVKDGLWNKLTSEAKKIVTQAQGRVVKVILETSLLTEEEIFQSAASAARGGVHILKTSTGFGARGVNMTDLKILSRVTAQHEKSTGLTLGIKASGGIRSFADALSMVQLGATRLGTSAGVTLVSALQPVSQESY